MAQINIEMKKMNGILCRDEIGNVLINDGCVQCVIEDGRVFQIKYDKIDFSSNTLDFVLDNVEISVNLSTVTPEETTKNIDEAQPCTAVKENKNCNKKTADVFSWDDASTKLFLHLYKCKNNLVNERKIKTYKLLWNNLAEDMGRNGYSVSLLQIENKFKSLTRSYKNMINNNKKTGRGRMTCKYEAELTDLFMTKHNINPLALSGRNGLMLREKQNSKTENNTMLNLSVNNESENELDETNSVAESNASIAGTSTSSISENKSPQKIKYRRRRTDSLKECLTVIQSFSSEMKSEKENNKKMQVEIFEEYKSLKKLQEDFISSTTKQWAIANAQREEKNNILREIAKNFNKKKEV